MWSQNVKIVIPAGTSEDKELTAIAAEPDAQKRMAMYEDFAKKYDGNKAAAAYADWQLSQQYLSQAIRPRPWSMATRRSSCIPTIWTSSSRRSASRRP